MKSVMQHQFSQVPKATIQRSSFDRSHGYKSSFDGGFLVPIFCDEALPGDTFNLKMTAFARLATPIKPIMDNMYMESFFFAVPMRLLWDNFQAAMGDAPSNDPGSFDDHTTPQITIPTGLAAHTLTDYFGLPLDISNTYDCSALWHRAYNFIWNEWFRDQNLQAAVAQPTDDGPDTFGDYVLLRRGKRHDYFTSCLPWPQKGDAINLPLGGTAPIIGLGTISGAFPEDVNVRETGQTSGTINYPFAQETAAASISMAIKGTAATAAYPEIYADLSNATAVTINSLREAFQFQKMLERDARGGTRYTEVIRSHFGVTSPDARLQRPEFLGGGSTPVNIRPVEQTATESGSTPQGNLAAFGTVQAYGHGFTKSFTEHCILMGFVNVRADLTYQQGLNRMWSRLTRFDYYWPALAHLGEQAVISKEIFLGGNFSADEGVFGYNERFAEYRYKPSVITGKFRSSDAATLDIWHLSQDFSSRPSLGSVFIQDTPPIDRVIAVQTEPHFLLDCHFSLRCARPMPLYGVPGDIDRF